MRSFEARLPLCALHAPPRSSMLRLVHLGRSTFRTTGERWGYDAMSRELVSSPKHQTPNTKAFKPVALNPKQQTRNNHPYTLKHQPPNPPHHTSHTTHNTPRTNTKPSRNTKHEPLDQVRPDQRLRLQLRPRPRYNLQPCPRTQNSYLSILNPKPLALNPKPQILNHKP